MTAAYIKFMLPIFGLVIGSFANVLIYRIPKKEEWVKTPSHCPNCGHPLSFIDMIPVLSWLALRGKCRFCKNPISFRYPFVELINGGLWLICSLAFGLTPFLFVSLSVSTSLLVIAAIDLETQEIPDGINFFLLAVGIIWNIYALFAGYGIWLSNLIGFFCVSSLLLLIAALTNGGMGGGDIKLTAVCGLILGWKNILLSLALSSIIGTIILLPALLKKQKNGKSAIPFGPFLALGIFLAMCFGDRMLALYISLI